jgi:hypothetical protein
MGMLPVPLNNRLDGPIRPPERSQPKMIPQHGAPRTQSFSALLVSRIDCNVPIDYTRIGTSGDPKGLDVNVLQRPWYRFL